MLYKHWKKVLLSLTAFFWASCDDTASASNEPESSSSVESPKSSAATGGTSSSSVSENSAESSATETSAASSAEESATSSSSAVAESSAGEEAESSTSEQNVASSGSEVKSSSSHVIIAPKYGVQMSSSSEIIAPTYGVPAPTCEKSGSKLTCDDGVTCEEIAADIIEGPECSSDVCAKYGVVVVKGTTYKCDDGKVYNEAEFRAKYTILDGAVDLYGCPSDICGPDTLVEAQPLYGVSNTVTRPY